jgi:tripartite-type tricarboxylate transporter receptor subunit TctC
LPDFHVSAWEAIWAPRGTPKTVVEKLDAAVVQALADAAVRKRLSGLDEKIFSRDLQTPESLATLQKAELNKWWPIIKAANIKAE